MNSSTLKTASAIAVLCWLQMLGMPAATAQGNELMMEVLLRPTGWRGEWAGPGGSGVTEVVFQRQAEKLIAKLHLIVPIDMTCEKPVTVGPGTVSFDGCRDPSLTLLFNPDDREVPFRGQSPRGYEWKLKAK